MYPISDLTAFCRRTTGDVPPKLVGASTTVVGSKMYLYGGRLVSERRMVSDIYMFDLETFVWERLPQSSEDDIPQARYFHSADTWQNHLIIFGGMAIKPQSDNPEDLCVLNDVRLFDLTTGHWLPSSSTPGDASPASFIPNARYAHLSSVTADRLFIIGGQDLANVWLDDVYIYDLVAKAWIQRREYSRHCGTYRSVAVTADMRVRLPQEELRTGQPSSSNLGPAGTRFKVNKVAAPSAPVTQSESLVHLPYSAPPTDEYPCDIFLFSNYNFTDVQRELEVFSPLSDGDFTVSDRSASMTGTSFPPGLRFPTGAILGTFFIVAGTYLSQTYQSFSIWALDLINMTWSRIDPGSALATGSWFRSCLWPAANKFLVFGNRHGNLVEDYNRRLLSWDHVTCIDLEAFGIYQPPSLVLDIPSQELGLAAFEEGVLTDFEIVCDDDRKIECSRKLLEDRWPWFKEQRRLFVQSAQRTTETMPAISQHVPLPELPGVYDGQEPRPDPRLTPRAFHLSEPYPITLALVQYFYSMALITPLQHAPAVLSQLLLLSSTYNLDHLQTLVKHAMHRALSYATSVGIYGVSTLCSCRSLQIRALRVVMAYSQKRPAGGRARLEKDGSSGGRNPDSTNGDSGQGNGGPPEASAARPRGMSDASYLRGPSEGSSSGSNAGYRRAIAPVSSNGSNSSPMRSGRMRAMSEVLPSGHQIPMGSSYGQCNGSPPESLPEKSFSVHSPSPLLAVSGLPSGSFAPQNSWVERKRSDSMVSVSTERDLSAIVELISPAVDATPVPSTTPQPVLRARSSSSALLNIYRSSALLLAAHPAESADPSSVSLTPSSSGSSASESDSEYLSDGFCDSAVYSPTQSVYPAFHLPLSPRRTSNRDSDTPSLTPSTSFSSLSTPSLSRTSSFYRSPPLSPISSSLSTPVDATPTSPHPGQSLHAIDEAATSGVAEMPHRLSYNGDGGIATLPSLGIDLFNGRAPFDNNDNQDAAAAGPSLHSDVSDDLERLRLDTTSPETIRPRPSSRSASPPPLSPKSQRSGNAFSRLFAKDTKRHHQPRRESDLEHVSRLNGSVLSLSMAKAEEKRRKRAAKAAKLDMDVLRRALDLQSERTERPWEPMGGYAALG